MAHWPFDGNALDVGGNELHGSLLGAQPTEDRFGRMGRALWFDGSAGVNVAHDALLHIEDGITVSLWIKPDSLPVGGNRMVFGKSNYTTATNFLLRLRPGGFLQWEYLTYTESIDLPLLAGTWHHVAVTANGPGSEKKIYVDGVDVQTSTPPGTAFGLVSDPLTFGYAGYGSEYFFGALDEIRIHARALTEAEILELIFSDVMIFVDGFE